MKVWVIGRNYPQEKNQMKGSFELEQAKMLAKKGMEVYYLTALLHPFRKIKGTGLQIWKEDAVTIITYSHFFPPRIKNLYFPHSRDKIWEKFFKEVEKNTGKPDVIHLHYPVMMLIANVLEEYHNQGIKIVVTEHWTKVLAKKLDSYEIIQQKKYMDIVDDYICVGYSLKKAIQEITESDREILIVPNVINKYFKPTKKQHDGYVFVAIGRLVKIKQFDKIIKAFSTLFKKEGNVKLKIIGGGKEESNLKHLVKKLDVEDQVVLTGSLGRKETAEIVSNADCLICYSTFETFGVPVIEAWSCGIPTISTTACEVMEHHDEKMGFEISPYDINELKTKMRYMYENSDKFQKNYLIDYANSHYSENVVSNKLIEIYNQ